MFDHTMQSSNFKLLLLSDDEFYRELIHTHLRSWAHLDVVEMKNAGSLLAYDQTAPDFILMDEQFEDHQVEELVSVLRLKFSDVPLTIFTSDETTGRRLQLKQLGAYEVIVKDENLCDLLEFNVNGYIQQLQLQRNNENLRKRIEKNFILSATPSILSKTIQEDETSLEDYTMQIIHQYLAKYNNNVVLVARKLGVGKSTIYRYLKDNKLKLSGDPFIMGGATSESMLEHASGVQEYRSSSSASHNTGSVLESAIEWSSPNAPTDLSFLFKVSKGNPIVVINMVETFFRSAGKLIEQLKQFQTNRDAGHIINTLHKFKPTVDSVGMRSLKNLILNTEERLSAKSDWAEIDRCLEEVYTTYYQCENSLRQQRDRLKSAGTSL